MTERERLIDQFEREIAGHPWHGASLTAILDGLDAAQAANKPSPEAHSIWEILLHMTGWKREVTRRAQGQRAGEPPEGDWPAVGDVSESRWDAAQADHLAAQQELLDLVRGMTDEQLGTKVAGEPTPTIGAGLSVKATLYGLLQHDVYHAGQIALLKRMAGSTIRYGV